MDACGSHAATETPEESAPLTEEETSVLEALKAHIGEEVHDSLSFLKSQVDSRSPGV